MFLTLYKTGRGGQNYFYTLHDLQPGLFKGYCLTILFGKVGAKGHEKKYTYDTKTAKEHAVRLFLAKKQKTGYKLIYNYPKEIAENAS